MKRISIVVTLFFILTTVLTAQKLPTGNPADFRVKTCLHSVSYMGIWRGQATLTVDEFLMKAKELGFDGVMLAAKRPHVSLIDYDDAARQKLRARLKELGLELVCLAGYNDFTAGVDKAGVPNTETQAVYIGELARLARDLGTNMVRIYTGYERSRSSLRQTICNGCRRTADGGKNCSEIRNYPRGSVVSCSASAPSQRMIHSSLEPLRSETNAIRERNGPGRPVKRCTRSLARVWAMVAASEVPLWSRFE